MVNIAVNATINRYGSYWPAWFIVALWLLPLVPFGIWAFRHERMLMSRVWIRQKFKEHPISLILICLFFLVIVANSGIYAAIHFKRRLTTQTALGPAPTPPKPTPPPSALAPTPPKPARTLPRRQHPSAPPQTGLQASPQSAAPPQAILEEPVKECPAGAYVFDLDNVTATDNGNCGIELNGPGPFCLKVRGQMLLQRNVKSGMCVDTNGNQIPKPSNQPPP